MAAALRHAGRTEHARRCCGRTGRSGSHQAAVRGLPGRVASARSGGGWQPSGHDAIGGMRHRQQCAPSRHRARTRRSETRRPDGICSRSVIGALPDRSAHSRRYLDGNLVASVAACAVPERIDLCGATRVAGRANRRAVVAESSASFWPNTTGMWPGPVGVVTGSQRDRGCDRNRELGCGVGVRAHGLRILLALGT
jgi:hypothetical protein